MIPIVTLDFETYYDKEYSLSKITVEAYVRSPLFEVIMLGIRWPDGTKEMLTGTHAEIKMRLDAVPWHEYAVLAHNTIFDGAILAWIFGVRPKVWLNTMAMANAMHHGKPASLAALAEYYKLRAKSNVVHNMMGRRRLSLSAAEFQQYAEYCMLDVELCYELFELMAAGWYNPEEMDLREPFPVRELELIDAHIRMFTEPVLRLNKEKLETHMAKVVADKKRLLDAVSVDKELLSSNVKFAQLLDSLGVAPPMKISKTTKKLAFAFAKTDQGMRDLLEHDDPRVQALAAARMGVKSTLEETRTQRFIDIATRSPLFPVPLKYYAARTGRSGGTDGINLQNLPARGSKKLKEAIEFPPRYVGCNSDSSNIEARMLAWLAMQDDLVADFANGVDVYSKMASRIYNRHVDRKRTEIIDGKEVQPDFNEGFVGKTVVLGCGYQTGAAKLQATLKSGKPSIDLPIEECKRIVDTYRETNYMIPRLWKQADTAIQAMHDNQGMWLGREGVLWVDGKNGIKLPNGLYIQYPQLHKRFDKEQGRYKWMYKDRNGMVDIYGGKIVENCVQGLARIIVMYQLLKIRKRYRVTLTVHDSVVPIAPEAEAQEFKEYVEACMRWVPKWAVGCPINCEAKLGTNYGEC